MLKLKQDGNKTRRAGLVDYRFMPRSAWVEFIGIIASYERDKIMWQPTALWNS
jgi:hypothetical protein